MQVQATHAPFRRGSPVGLPAAGLPGVSYPRALERRPVARFREWGRHAGLPLYTRPTHALFCRGNPAWLPVLSHPHALERRPVVRVRERSLRGVH
jgi:hypothetical protein